MHVATGTILAIWLKEEGVTLTNIGLLSLVKLPYIFKFSWAPLLDYLNLRFHNYVDVRKCLLSICLLLSSLCLYILSHISPTHSPILFISILLIISFFASIYDVLMHVSQLLGLKPYNWGYGEAAGVSGFRFGLLLSGAGTLFLSSFITWSQIYHIISFIVLFPLAIIWSVKISLPESRYSTLSTDLNLKYNLIEPFKDFFNKSGWIWILLLMIFFRLQDFIKGSMLTLFYLENGYTKEVLSIAYKTFGFIISTIGGIIGGALLRKYGYRISLKVGLISHAVSSFIFFLPQFENANIIALYIGVFIHELTKGIAIAPFFSYQLYSASPKYAISQIALLTSVATLSQSIFGSFSGYLVDNFGWMIFFAITILSSLPALYILKKVPYDTIPAFKLSYKGSL